MFCTYMGDKILNVCAQLNRTFKFEFAAGLTD